MEEKRPKYPENQIVNGKPIWNQCEAVYAGPVNVEPVMLMGYAGPDGHCNIGMPLGDDQKMTQTATPSDAPRPEPETQKEVDATCLSCGGKVYRKGKFCPNCGMPLKWDGDKLVK